MLLGLISDLHSNLPSLKKAYQLFDELGVDEVLCAGDVVGYYARPLEVIDLLRERCNHVVMGNHDAISVSDDFQQEIRYFNDMARQALVWTRKTLRKSDEHWDYIASLPMMKHVKVGGMKVLLVHSTPDPDPEEWVYFTYHNISDQDVELTNWLNTFDADLIMIGHTHVPFIFQTDEKTPRIVLNPGSTGQPRDSKPAGSFMTLDTNTREVEHVRYKFSIEKVCKQLKQENLPDYLCQRLFMGL